MIVAPHCCCEGCIPKSILISAYVHGFTRLGTNDSSLLDYKRYLRKEVSYSASSGIYYYLTMEISEINGRLTFTEDTNANAAQKSALYTFITNSFNTYKSEFGSGEILGAGKTILVPINPSLNETRIWSVSVSNENTRNPSERLSELEAIAIAELADVPDITMRVIQDKSLRHADTDVFWRGSPFGQPYAVVLSGVMNDPLSPSVADLISGDEPTEDTVTRDYNYGGFYAGLSFDFWQASEVYDWNNTNAASPANQWPNTLEAHVCNFVQEETLPAGILLEQFSLDPRSVSAYHRMIYKATTMCVSWDMKEIQAAGGSASVAPICETGSYVISPLKEMFPTYFKMCNIGYATAFASVVEATDEDDCSCSLAP